MRHVIIALVALVLPLPALAQSIKGVWKPVEAVVSGGANAGTRTDLAGLIIISDSHYSVTLEGTGSAGSYELTDVALILMPTVAVNATGPAGTQALPVRLVVDSLWLTTKEWFGPGTEARLKLVRLSGAPVVARGGGRNANAEPPADDSSMLIGSWKLNVDKSEFIPGPYPQSGQATFERTATGIRFTGTTVDTAGNTLREEWVGMEDGRDYPYKGTRDFDTQSVRITGRSRAEIITKRNGRIAMGGDRVISSNGKTLTITLKGTDASGRVVKQVMVFERQR